MRTPIYWTTVTFLMALGCSGLMGYGEEIASADVQSGERFKLDYTPTTDAPHQLWIDTKLSWTGSEGHIKGKLKVGKGELMDVDFDHDEAPMGGGRVTLNTVETTRGMSGTVWVMELPASAAGESVTVQGKWTGDKGTTIEKLRFVVTD